MADADLIRQRINDSPDALVTFSGDWPFYLDAYQGTGPFQDGSALVQFPRESVANYADRQALAYYPNFCAPVVDIFTSTILKRGVHRDLQSEPALTFTDQDVRGNEAPFIENVNRSGDHIDTFMAEVSTLTQVFGWLPVLIDAPPLPEDLTVMSRQDQIDAGLLPYFQIIYPTNVVTWDTDHFGDLRYLVWHESEDKDRFSGQLTQHYRYVDRESWAVIRSVDNDLANAEVVEQGEHPLDEVPIQVFKYQPYRQDALIGLSHIRDIAKVNKRLMNLYSELDQILRNQTFSVLTIPKNADEPPPEVGTRNALTYDPESKNKPEFIAPDSAQAERYMDVIEMHTKEIFRLARLEPFAQGTNLDLSGAALSYRFRNTNSALSGFADKLEDGENELWRKWSAWQGATFSGSVTYPDEFDIADVNQMLDQALTLQTLNMPTSFDRRFKRQLVMNLLDDANDAEIQEIFDELDEMAPAEVGAQSDDAGVADEDGFSP